MQNCQETLHPHQVAPADYLLKHPKQKGLIVAYATGTGKSFTAANTAVALLRRGGARKIMVVAPKSTMSGWKGTFARCELADKELKRVAVFTTHESAQKHVGAVTGTTFLIVDEAHEVRNPSTTKSKAVRAMVRRCRQCLLMTATPGVNGAGDAAELLRMLLPGTYRSVAAVPVSSEAKIARAFKNHVAYFMEQDESYFPRWTRRVERVPLSDKQVRAIHAFNTGGGSKAARAIVAELSGSGGGVNASVANSYMNKTRRLSITTPNECSPKVLAIAAKIVRGALPALVFTAFRGDGADRIERCIRLQLRKAGRKGVGIEQMHGSLSAAARKKLIEDFNGGRIGVLIITHAGGTGVDLRGVRQLHIAAMEWNMATVKQWMGRGVRYKSHAHLPVRERHVAIHLWVGTKKGSKLAKKLLPFAPDEHLLAMMEAKEAAVASLERGLERASINVRKAIAADLVEELKALTLDDDKKKREKMSPPAADPALEEPTAEHAVVKLSRRPARAAMCSASHVGAAGVTWTAPNGVTYRSAARKAARGGPPQLYWRRIASV